MPLSAPPTAPNRTVPSLFSSRMDAFLAWLQTLFTAGMGYGTGAGGAVTQLTSRTTGVTLNKVCGTITLFSAAGSTTWAAFTLTNSFIEAGDVLVMSQQTGANTYNMTTKCAAGSAVIAVQSAVGTATEAPVLNFALIKATNS